VPKSGNDKEIAQFMHIF